MTGQIHTAPVTESDWVPHLAHDIASEHRQAQESAQTAVAHARRAGELLVQAKHRIAHGEWAAWCEAELPFGDRMAQRYMRIARKLPRLPAQQAEQISELSLRDALKMLSEPKEPRNGKTDPPQNKELEPKPTRVTVLPRGSDMKLPKPSPPAAMSEPEELEPEPNATTGLISTPLNSAIGKLGNLPSPDLVLSAFIGSLCEILNDVTDDDEEFVEDCGLWEAWKLLPETDKPKALSEIKCRIDRLVELHRRLSGGN